MSAQLRVCGEGPTSSMAHKLTGDDRCFSSFEVLLPQTRGAIMCLSAQTTHWRSLTPEKSLVASTLQRGKSDHSDPLLYENTLVIRYTVKRII